MKYLMILVMALALTSGMVESPTYPDNPFGTKDAGAGNIKWVNAPSTSRGGYYRDCSNNGIQSDNANALGWND